MGVTIRKTGGELSYRLRQMGDRAANGGARIMRQGAKNIEKRAREYAPIDKGNLEAAIRVEEAIDANRRKQFEVYVAASVNGVNVDDYAWYMHEGLPGIGGYNLGKRSLTKQAANPARRVGRKYLERAVNDFKKEIIAKLEKNMRDAAR